MRPNTNKPYLNLFASLTLSASAFALDPHVEAVTRTVEAAKGTVEKTEDGQSLKLVDLAMPGGGGTRFGWRPGRKNARKVLGTTATISVRTVTTASPAGIASVV